LIFSILIEMTILPNLLSILAESLLLTFPKVPPSIVFLNES